MSKAVLIYGIILSIWMAIMNFSHQQIMNLSWLLDDGDSSYYYHGYGGTGGYHK